MSYIHEALKKAQGARDRWGGKYAGVSSTQEKKRRAFIPKTVGWGFLAVFGVFLAFVLYSWLDSGTPRPLATTPRPSQERPKAALPARKMIDPGKIYEKARLFHKRGRLQDARRLYEETLRIDPGYTEALNNLGVIEIREKKYDAARIKFEKAIRLNPTYVDPHYNLACLCALTGDVAQGLVHLRKAVSLDNAVREWARNDTDLEGLRRMPEFQNIIGQK
jgi:tetratricopeptide (TPR) repeat protein